MALGSYESEVGRGNVLNALAHPTVVNPLGAIGGAVNVARGVADLKTTQFNLQQAQLQPGYQAMRMLGATNPNPSADDITAALGGAARIGGNVDGLVSNLTDWTARGGKPADFVRAYALGGMTPENQARMGIGDPTSQDTGAGTLYGMRGGALSAAPGQFTPSSFVRQGLTPGQATDMIQVGVNPDGSPIMKPRGATYGQPYGGGAPGAGTGGGSGAVPAGPPPGSNIAPNTPLSQKDADLAMFAQRESGNQNIQSKVPPPPGYTQAQTGSGYYQMIPSTWASGARAAGVDLNKYPTPMSAPADVQYKVASAVYDMTGGHAWDQTPWTTGHYAGGPNAQWGAPGMPAGPPGSGGTVATGPGGGGGGGGGGPPASGTFIGATSAQPVAGPSANVRPAGGMQYFSPTGQPEGAGGGGGQGGAAPYTGYTGLPATFEKTAGASADMFNTARASYSQQAQRISPLEQSLATLRAHPDLQTGMTAMDFQNINSLAQVLGVQLTPQTIADGSALTEINKNLNRYYRGLPGANRSDMAELDAKLANPSPENQRDALDDLLARTIGTERMNDAGYMHFLELHGSGNVSSYAGQYADQTGQYTSKLDPVGFAFDKMTTPQRRAYFDSLSPTERTRYMNSIKEASRLYSLPIPQGG